MHKNSRMEKPTRKANALAILREVVVPDGLPRSMNNNAAPRLPKMAMNATITRYVMVRIIG